MSAYRIIRVSMYNSYSGTVSWAFAMYMFDRSVNLHKIEIIICSIVEDWLKLWYIRIISLASLFIIFIVRDTDEFNFNTIRFCDTDLIIVFEQGIILYIKNIRSKLDVRNIDKNEYCNIDKSTEFLNNFIWRWDGERWPTNVIIKLNCICII